jgi:hypothetical protein
MKIEECKAPKAEKRIGLYADTPLSPFGENAGRKPNSTQRLTYYSKKSYLLR